MLKDIYQRLGLETDLNKEKTKFYRRINMSVKLVIDPFHNSENYETYEEIKDELKFKLGEMEMVYIDDYFTKIRTFEEYLMVYEIFLNILNKFSSSSYEEFKKRIKEAINESAIDLGIVFENDKFMLKGAEELDKKLILETLDWINDYPNTRELFDGALKEYLLGDYADAITKCYSSIENLAQTFLNSDKSLDNLVQDLLRELNLPQQWKSILNNYCDYAHKFSSRHGNAGNKEPVKFKDVEAYIYFTGILIRLIIQTINEIE